MDASTRTESSPDSTESLTASAPAWVAVARGVSLLLGLLAALHLYSVWRVPGYDGSLWLLDHDRLPAAVQRAIAAAAAVVLLTFALAPHISGAGRVIAALLVLMLFAGGIMLTFDNYRAIAKGTLRTAARFPFSLYVSVCLAIVWLGILRSARSQNAWRDGVLAAFALVASAITWPAAQMYCLGNIDERRAADVAVVAGCGGASEDKCTPELADRVRTACQLHQEGLTAKLLLTGSPAQTTAMRKLATANGVPSNEVTVHVLTKTAPRLVDAVRQAQPHRVLAVSHDMELPRLKLQLQHADHEVFTVPAAVTSPPPRRLQRVLKESAALWRASLRPALRSLRRESE